MTREFHLGQLFIVGFPGSTPTSILLNFLTEEEIGGVILFADNCETHQQARQSIELIRSQYSMNPPFIAIDQEGGRVCRLKGAPVEYRSAASYGQSDDLEHFVEEYSRAAVYMRELGININLAPVADLEIDPENSCIAGRSFGAVPEKVAAFVAALVRVSKSSGLLSCLKHFPGFGAATNDPHQIVASADYDLATWRSRESLPFAAGIEAGADMLMTTHLRVQKLDYQIATTSQKILKELIRGSLEFDGPIITDDLCMGGARELGDPGERAVAAFNAGHDILLFGQDLDASMQAYDYFSTAVKVGEVSQDRVRAALNRVAGLKFALGRTQIS